MNKIIKDQLLKVKSTKIEFNDDTTEILIKKVNNVPNSMICSNKIYLIRLKDYITNPSSNSTLASNWNAGIIPKYTTYKVELVQKMGNMIRFSGIPIDNGNEILTENFFYWLPDDSFDIIDVY